MYKSRDILWIIKPRQVQSKTEAYLVCRLERSHKRHSTPCACIYPIVPTKEKVVGSFMHVVLVDFSSSFSLYLHIRHTYLLLCLLFYLKLYQLTCSKHAIVKDFCRFYNISQLHCFFTGISVCRWALHIGSRLCTIWNLCISTVLKSLTQHE
jgi:hypothetical protein